MDSTHTLTGLRAELEALAHSPQADQFRDEAARGVAELPYANNRYLHLLDDLRAALARHPEEGGVG